MKSQQTNTKTVKVFTDGQRAKLEANQRKTKKSVSKNTENKENIAGRANTSKDVKMAADSDIIKKKTVEKSVQTEERTEITEEDLMSDNPGELYWKTLAEKRQEALDESFHEREQLKDFIANLKEENRICNEMLDESKTLIEVLQETLEEVSDDDGATEATGD